MNEKTPAATPANDISAEQQMRDALVAMGYPQAAELSSGDVAQAALDAMRSFRAPDDTADDHPLHPVDALELVFRDMDLDVDPTRMERLRAYLDAPTERIGGLQAAAAVTRATADPVLGATPYSVPRVGRAAEWPRDNPLPPGRGRE